MAQFYVEYDSNNSGGHWWLEDKDWKALEAAGWKVKWATLEEVYDTYDEDGTPKLQPYNPDKQFAALSKPNDDGRWMGALATTAYKPGAASLREAAEEWERVTGKSSTDAGCPCCGQPHRFTLYKNGKWVDSGPSTSYEASW